MYTMLYVKYISIKNRYFFKRCYLFVRERKSICRGALRAEGEAGSPLSKEPKRGPQSQDPEIVN